jgi:DNA anti-recombination protein RmuC
VSIDQMLILAQSGGLVIIAFLYVWSQTKGIPQQNSQFREQIKELTGQWNQTIKELDTESSQRLDRVIQSFRDSEERRQEQISKLLATHDRFVSLWVAETSNTRDEAQRKLDVLKANGQQATR